MASTSIPAQARPARRSSKRLLALRGDEHLVARAADGDDVAFEVIYERHVGGILSFCRHMLRDPEEAEDAVQQTFVSAHSDLLRGGRDIRLKPWLYAIARNRCISILRMRRERPTDQVGAVTAGLGDEVRRRADLRELLADLHDLSEDQRAALVLTEMEDLSHAEVAKVLGCGVGQVKGLVFRARSGLIERREARMAPCDEIREELASARRGAFRRGRLRHHLAACPDCAAYLKDIRRQRRMMALVLPVAPSAALKHSVLASAGIGGGGVAAGAGVGAAAAGGLAAALPAAGTTIAKVAVLGVLAGTAGVAGRAAIEDDPPRPSDAAPNAVRGPADPATAAGGGAARDAPAPQVQHGASVGAERRRGRSSEPAHRTRSRTSGARSERGPHALPGRGADQAPGRRAPPHSTPREGRGGGSRARSRTRADSRADALPNERGRRAGTPPTLLPRLDPPVVPAPE